MDRKRMGSVGMGYDGAEGGYNVRAMCLRSVELLIELRVFIQNQHLG